jgi:hypothetical protein
MAEQIPPVTSTSGHTPDPTPGTVVLCGSVSRAVAALDAARRHYEALGHVVHMPVADDSRTPEEHAARWYALIDACGPDDTVVMCQSLDGMGEQTRRELDRARAAHKTIEYWASLSERAS